jgi:DNA anti-recombination protein RmuC
MGSRPARWGFALVAAAILLASSPAHATSAESQENSLQEEFESFAQELKAHSARLMAAATQAARQALDDNQDKINEAQDELAAQLDSFRALLNEQKARLGMIGEDAAAAFDDWTRAAIESWAEMHRSTLETLDRLERWLEQQESRDAPIRT